MTDLDRYTQKVGWRGVRGGTLPRSLPAKPRVLVHNQVDHFEQSLCGANGFRAWTQKRDKTLIKCHCGWASLPHYRKR